MSTAPQPPLPPGITPGPPVPRSSQRRSVFSGLLLIFLGLLFLLFRFDPELRLGHLIWRFWPVIIIVWGVAKLVDHLFLRHTGERTAVLTGGEAALLILVIFCLAAVGLADHLRHRHDLTFNFHPFASRYSQSEELPAANVAPGAHVTIETARGNISVHVGGGNVLRVTVNKFASDPSESAANERMAAVKTVMERTADGFSVHPMHQDDSEGALQEDLDVEIPKTASVTVNAAQGDITVAGVAGAVDATASSGDIDVHGAGSDVSATLSSGNLRISDVAGSVRVSGHGNEVDVSDVSGDATFNGEFLGPVRVRNVSKTTRYFSERSSLTLDHMTGRLELDSGDLRVSEVAGAAKIATRNKDVEVEDVGGALELADSHGDITLRYAQPPAASVSVSDESGEVGLTIPSQSSFEISAVSQSGKVDSEFQGPSLELVNDSNVGRLNGRLGGGGPKITIVTSYGTISIHKTS